MENIDELERKINSMAAKYISDSLGSNASDNYTVSPFKISQSNQKGNGLGGYINQNTQLEDFESWVSPGNYVLHILNK